MIRNLDALFCPKSVAIIGASDNPQKVGAIILKNILASGYLGNIYPVNPHLESIQNIKCYKSATEIPEVPEVAVIAVPAGFNPEVLNQIGEKGIKNVICIASGFKESGEEGQRLEDSLLETVKKYGINLLGPNCLGLANNNCPLNATFGKVVNIPGNLRFISQSGAIAASIFDWCKSTNLGFSKFVTLGNKTDLNENNILEYFLDDQQEKSIEGLSKVSPIGLYLESISDGPKFLEITKEISKINPIFILKPGKTKVAAKAMQSHTGSLAGADDVLDEALKETGIIRCQSLEDFFDLARAFSFENAPEGPNIAIISNAGGPAVISADAVAFEGLQLAEFDEQTKKQLSEVLPRFASILNPVDVLGDALAERFTQAAEIILQTNQVNALVVILTPQVMTQIEKTAQSLGVLSKKYQKPILCSFIGGDKVFEGEQILNGLQIPVFRFPERAIFALGKMWQWKQNQFKEEKVFAVEEVMVNSEATQKILKQAEENNQKVLDNFQANQIISSIGISTPPTSSVGSFEQAKIFAGNFGYPVVLKLSSPGLLHKKEIGGIITNINNEEELEIAWDRLERKISHFDIQVQKNIQIQIQKEILNGVEVILGVKKDQTFGPVLLFGAGGTFAELLVDKNLHLLPLEIPEAKKLVEKSKIFPILNGYRGEPTLALDKLYEDIVRIGKFAATTLEIEEVEINPLIVTLNNVWAVDSKVVLGSGENISVSLPKFQEAITLSHEVLAGTYHYFNFQTPKSLNLMPGQYISVKVAPERLNCYSVATNESSNKFSLLIDTKPSGLGSKFFENLKQGDKISFLGPFGKFTLNLNDGAKQLLFLATGSGVAPLRIQVEAALKDKKLNCPITLYLGVNSNKDLFWQDVFQNLSKEYPNFNFKTAIFDPQWGYAGYKGYITDLLKNDIADASGVSAYLCGNKNMIADATQILLEKGCPKERIYTEKY